MPVRLLIPIVIATIFLRVAVVHGELDSQVSTPFKIACVGDSITFGAEIENRRVNCYPTQLSKRLSENVEVGNFGQSGATLLRKGVRPYWKNQKYQAAFDFKPNLVIIVLGTNDSKPQNWVHKDEFVNDYVDMIHSFQNLPSRPTVWICYPVPAFPGDWGIRDEVIKNEVIPRIDTVAEKAEVRIIDLYTALSNRGELFPDTVHPNAAGAKVMAETIAAAINGTFE